MSKLHCLIVNIGSPRSAKLHDVASFIRHFLMDKYVMRKNYLLRFLLVYCLIVPLRKRHSRSLYLKIVKDEKSEMPIIDNTKRLISKIESNLREKGCDVDLSFAMRYGEYTIDQKIEELSKQGVKDLFIIPMFPQNENSTYLSSIQKVKKCCNKWSLRPLFTLPFYNHGDYISSLERSIREKLQGVTVDKMIFSYHGTLLSYLPCGEKRARECKSEGDCVIDRTPYCRDCYKYQCSETTRLVCANLDIEREDYQIVYQSKLGHSEWLTPSLTECMKELPNSGIKDIAVISPSFPADCLETIFEVDIEARGLFLDNGGETFNYIPALNDLNLWAKKLSKWIIEADNHLRTRG